MVVSARHYRPNYHKKYHKYALVKVCMGSLHHTKPSEHRNPEAQMQLCLEAKGFVRPLVPSPLHRPVVVCKIGFVTS